MSCTTTRSEYQMFAFLAESKFRLVLVTLFPGKLKVTRFVSHDAQVRTNKRYRGGEEAADIYLYQRCEALERISLIRYLTKHTIRFVPVAILRSTRLSQKHYITVVSANYRVPLFPHVSRALGMFV